MQIYNKLTPYPEGSLRELWCIALPLMVSALSVNFMLFLDRIILARYSTNAMNAAATVGMLCCIFQFGAIGISSIAEVFVGQYNGANEKKRLGEPVWQMIWFSIMTWAVFAPTALGGGEALVAESFHTEGIPYFRWIMLFGPLMPMIAALSAFFIGQGKTKLVLYSTLVGNLINFLLDIVLVFGIRGVIPSMGTTGAAIATVTSMAVQTIILFAEFLNANNCKHYGTHLFHFKKSMFLKCLRIGGPNSLGHMVEIAAWAVVLRIMADAGKEHVTVFAIAQSIFLLVAFTSDGMQKGVISIASNLIGAKKEHMVKTHLLSAMRLQLLIAAVLSLPMIFYSDHIIQGFLPKDMATIDTDHLMLMTRSGLFFFWIYFMLDGITWIIGGILTAGGDTKFMMFMNAITSWSFCIVPVYIAVVKNGRGPLDVCALLAGYALLNSIAVYLRYRMNRWKKSLTDEQRTEELIT